MSSSACCLVQAAYLPAVGELFQRFGEAALRMGDLLDPASELPDRPPQFLLDVSVIIAGIRAANGDAIPAQAVDQLSKVRPADLKSGLQLTAGDDSQLSAVILLQVLGNRVVRCHEDSFPGQLPGKSIKKEGAVRPFRVTAPETILMHCHPRLLRGTAFILTQQGQTAFKP